MAIFSLLTHAHKLFREASIIQKLDCLETHFNRDETGTLDFQNTFLGLDPGFLDAFRIATCFENMFKAQLLKYGYVVHKIDGKKQGKLLQQQFTRPIRVREIKAVEGSNWQRSGQFKIQCLRRDTLTLGQMLSKKSRYKYSLRLSDRTIETLDQIRKQRNSVHLIVNDVRMLRIELFDSYRLLRLLVNSRLIKMHSEVIERWEHMRSNPYLRLNEI